MAGTEVLQEYLIELGYRVNGREQAKWDDWLKGAAMGAAKLTGALVAAATAATAAAAKISAGLEDLYWTSRRTNASAENIKAYSSAVSQLGGTAEGAMSSLEGLAEFMRSSPGANAMIESFGVKTRDSAGRLRDTLDVMHDLGAAFQRMPYYIARQRASMMGIDERTLQALVNPDNARYEARYRENAKALGVDLNTGTERAKEFMQSLRDLMGVFELLGIKITTDLSPQLRKGISAIRDWIIEHQTQITNAVSIIVKAFGFLLEALGKFLLYVDDLSKNEKFVTFLTQVTDGINEAAKAVGGWQNVFAGLLAFMAATWVAGMLAAIGKVALAMTGLISGPFKLLSLGLRVLTTGVGIGAFVAAMWPSETADKAQDEAQDQSGNQRIAGEQGDRAKQVYDAFRRDGYTHEQAAAWTANVALESGFDPAAANMAGGGNGARGLGQWRGARQKRFEQIYGKKLEDSTFEEQVSYLLWEARNPEQLAGESVRGSRTAAEAGANISRNFFRPGLTEAEKSAEAAKRAAAAEAWSRNLVNPDGPDAGMTPAQIRARDTLRRSGQQVGNLLGGPSVPPLPGAAPATAKPDASAPPDDKPRAPRLPGGELLIGNAPRIEAGTAIPAPAPATTTVTVTQNNPVTVTGVTDPEGTAAAVSSVQEKNIGDIVRNMRGAVR